MANKQTQQELDADLKELEQFTDDEICRYVANSCLRQRQAEADLAVYKEQYKAIIDVEKETRERLLGHLKARQDADKMVVNQTGTASNVHAIK